MINVVYRKGNNMKNGKHCYFVSGILCLITLTIIITSCGKSGPPAKMIQLSAIFNDHMVLQQGVAIPIWGDADPGSAVVVELAGQKKTAIVNRDGKWRLKLSSLKPGGPYTMMVIGVDTISISDVLVGEVWLCSGQSNMEWQVRNSKNAQEEMNDADWPKVRMFTVKKTVSEKPEDDCEGEWRICSPEAVGDFSAVGYFFGRYLHQKLNVPIGLIHSSWGGTPAEAWTRYATLASDSILVPILERYEELKKNYPQRLAEYKKQLKEVEESGKLLPVYQKDDENKGLKKGWANLGFDDSNWDDYNVPGFWENQENMQIDGAVWFRKTVIIPETWTGKELILTLGAIDDFDVTYFNGIPVGSTGEETPQFWIHQRVYTVPAGEVRVAEAVIAVRVFDHFGQGGFAGPGIAMKLALKSDQNIDPITLAGQWKCKVEAALDPSLISGPGGEGLPQEPRGPGHPHSPAGLYHAMIHPLAPYALKGAIWYQGESNAGRAYQYRRLLPAMIRDWRTLWNQDEFYFGIVQLANYMQVSDEPQESDWAELREAQLMTVLNDPLSGLATIIDIGEADDIHPRNKQDVGARLAIWALARCYSHDLEYSGPLYKSMAIEDGKIRLKFSHTADGLLIPGGGELKGFSIAGTDKNFVWANAKIDENDVIVWSDKVKNPVAVRYAWADNPVCNLYNSEMLPAVPFRSDNFRGITFQNR